MEEVKYQKMVLDLVKSGLIMREEWTNKEKECLYLFNELYKIANLINNYSISQWPPFHDERAYEINHMSFALLIEIGELGDPFKKRLIYRKEFTEDVNKNIKEEIGDILFYITFIKIFANKYNISNLINECNSFIVYLNTLCVLFDTSIDECKKLNYEKLSVRYSGFKYSNESAIARKDKE